MSASPAAPAVSVVVPHYESASTVRATIGSILAQTFEDFEILLIDDGSQREPLPDDLPEDPRLHVIHLERNGGYGRLTNQAVESARGEWVTFVDSDDTVAPTYLEHLVTAGEETGADVVFIPMIRVGGTRIIGKGPWNPPARTISSERAMRALLEGDLSGTQHLLLRRPRAISEAGQVYSDFIFTLRNVARAKVVTCIDEPLYFNTVHVGSATGSLRRGIWDLVAVNEIVRPCVESRFTPQESETLLRAHRDLTLTQILHTAANERSDSPLRREVTLWCRARITARGILDQVRQGHPMPAASWTLAKVSPAVHRRAYQLFDSRRKRSA